MSPSVSSHYTQARMYGPCIPMYIQRDHNENGPPPPTRSVDLIAFFRLESVSAGFRCLSQPIL